jgi:hypothetical protein
VSLVDCDFGASATYTTLALLRSLCCSGAAVRAGQRAVDSQVERSESAPPLSHVSSGFEFYGSDNRCTVCIVRRVLHLFVRTMD